MLKLYVICARSVSLDNRMTFRATEAEAMKRYDNAVARYTADVTVEMYVAHSPVYAAAGERQLRVSA